MRLPMRLRTCLDAPKSLLYRFARCSRANAAVIFAIALVPVIVAAGMGLDYGRALVVRTRLAEALDAAALAVGGTKNLSQTQMQSLAESYFNANYNVGRS